MFEGSIDNNEFFVERDERLNSKDPGELWKKEFLVIEDKVPSIIARSDAQLVLDTGRVVNWLHRNC